MHVAHASTLSHGKIFGITIQMDESAMHFITVLSVVQIKNKARCSNLVMYPGHVLLTDRLSASLNTGRLETPCCQLTDSEEY